MKIDINEVSPIETLLSPEADLREITQDMLVHALEPALEYNKKVNILVGQGALVQEKLKDRTTLKDFAKELGLGEKSLNQYKNVEKNLQGIDLPDDLSYTARRTIAYSDNPKEVAKQVVDHGLSSAQVYRMFGKAKEEKKIKCPNCGVLL